MAFNHQRNLDSVAPLLTDGERIVTSVPGFFQYDFPDGEAMYEASLVITTKRLIGYRKKLLGSWFAEVDVDRVVNIDLLPVIMVFSGAELSISVVLVGFSGTEWKNWSVKLLANEKEVGEAFVRQVRQAFPGIGGLPVAEV